MQKWTDETIRAKAAKYQKSGEWQKNSNKSYKAAYRKGKIYFQSCCQHMIHVRRRSWTDESIRQEALKYNTRREFRNGSPSAYNAARKKEQTFYESCCQHMITQRVKNWTDESIRKEALKYFNRTEFSQKASSAYKAARVKGKVFFDSCCLHMVAKYALNWTKESIFAEALKYKTRNEFKHATNGAYAAAWKQGKDFAESCFKHMSAPDLVKKWTKEATLAEALKYQTRNDFKNNSESAYAAARKRGEQFAEICFKHMVDGLNSDNDAVYIWKAEREFYNGESVYKIGMTSARLGMRRIEQVAKETGFTATTVALIKVNGRATTVERKLLELGQDPKYLKFNGSTEFRAMSDAELQIALDLLNGHAVKELIAA